MMDSKVNVFALCDQKQGYNRLYLIKSLIYHSDYAYALSGPAVMKRKGSNKMSQSSKPLVIS